MPFNLKGRNLLTLLEYSTEEIHYLVNLAQTLKNNKRMGIYGNNLDNKNIALIFEKPSTRTRCAFVCAVNDEGGSSEYLSINDIQLGKKESVEDTARVLGRMFDGIQFRGFKQETVEKLGKYAGVPVWNGLTDLYHPTQILADLLTVKENFNKLRGIKFVYLGDGRNNMGNSLLIGCAKVGMDFTICAPEELWPEKHLRDEAEKLAEISGGSINFSEDVKSSVKGADVLYTDVWVSMGEEDKPEIQERLTKLKPYQVNMDMIKATENNQTIVLHCLPAVHDNEISHEAIESKHSKVFDQAENRLHTIKAVMVATV
ncbi:MAG: ornithine carbamoyltransferase [Candidatus Muiribacteriota bacterium]